MPARAIWKGAISFGLVQIPVELVSAESRHGGVSFTMLDQRNMARIGYERVNKETGERVPWDEIVKGYEIDDGEFVVLDDGDFARANVEATQTVEIVQFADADEVDWVYCEKPYYLRPTKRGFKAYALLRDTLRKMQKIGIATVVIRARQHVAAVMPRGAALALEILRYADEIRDEGEAGVSAEGADALGVSPMERQMAEQLVEGMTRPFDLSRFHDDYHDDLMRIIEEKAERGEVNVVTEPEEVERPAAREVDLMALLKQSLAETESGEAPAPAAKTKKPAAKTKKPAAKTKKPAAKTKKPAAKTNKAGPKKSPKGRKSA